MIGSDSLSQPGVACQVFCFTFFFFRAKNLPVSAGFLFIFLIWNDFYQARRTERSNRSPAALPPSGRAARGTGGLFFLLRNEREAACVILII